MKKIVWLGVLTVILSACDKVEDPIPANSANYDTDLYPGDYAADYPYPVFGVNNNTNVNVLIEDFTGHKCGNCPDAAETAKNIETSFEGRVISVGIHAGTGGISGFQKVNKPEDPDYPKYSTDFTNKDGLAYSVNISGFPGNPCGTVNRTIPDGSSNIWMFANKWQNETQKIINKNNLRANLQMETNYFPSTRGLFVHVQTETTQSLTGNYNLVIYLVEKSSIDWQKDYTMTPEDIDDYEHHNIHRGNINGTWGEVILTDETVAGVQVISDYTYELPSELEEDDLFLVAYLMNAETYEVIQVIKKDI